MENRVLKDGELFKSYVGLFRKLRKEIGIPLRQPLLDYTFGPKYLPKEWRRNIAEEINVLDQGYDLADRDYYTGYDITYLEAEDWKFCSEGGLWVGLNTTMPKWLKKIGDKRKEERKQIMRRKTHVKF